MRPAQADGLRRATEAFTSGDYGRTTNTVSPLARRGNARAQALLGFTYENGFGVPQAYEAAADLYARTAAQGDPVGQNRLGLLYDKGAMACRKTLSWPTNGSTWPPRIQAERNATITCGCAMP
jgi:TPR repeat protein